MAYLHVHAPCPTGWRFPSGMTTEVCRMQVRTNFVALWEYDPANGLRFTHRDALYPLFEAAIASRSHADLAAGADHVSVQMLGDGWLGDLERLAAVLL